MKKFFWILGLFIFSVGVNLFAQEVVAPLNANPILAKQVQVGPVKKFRINLPFIDDFAYNGPYPNPQLWEDRMAYINNTMSANPVNRGVATLDGLNANGRPYHSPSQTIGTADSLTSKAINLAGYTTASNLFLSFFVQPQGLGFAPEEQDSLFLFFKNSSNTWVRVWQTRGTPATAFKIVFVPVNQTQFYHSDFQFRFVNVASMNINDDIWNLDYIKLDANRSYTDSISNDIGFTIPPSSILSPYTEMPYRHFLANQANEKSGSQIFTISNLYNTNQNLTVQHESKEILSSTTISTTTLSNAIIGPHAFYSDNVLSYPISYTPPGSKSKVVIEDKYYYSPVNGTDRKGNDTITRQTIFDNYFAYDDGSAEKSYFLLPAFNYPSKTALAFHMNEPDTVRGLGVHFGAQVPTALGKYFSIVLYKQLGGNGFNDSIILQEDLFQVQYDTNYNGFSNYAFNTPPFLDSGTYYIGITQPANFGSDSLYYGLDVNNNGNLQHLYFNVSGDWNNSTVAASIMMRPLVGQYFTPTGTGKIVESYAHVTGFYPNPVTDLLNVSEGIRKVSIYSLDGKLLQQQQVVENKISLSTLPPQTYIVRGFNQKGKQIHSQIIIKK